MDLGKHTCDIAPGYVAQRSNQVKDVVLSPMDDLVQSANLLPERMPTNVEILKQEFDVEKRVSREKNMRLQEDLGQCLYDMEIQRDQI